MPESVYGVPCVQGHTAAIYDRGGVNRLEPLFDLNAIEWNRSRNEVTDGRVSLTGRSCDQQRSVINDVEPMRHELVIFRGQDRVWEGPIVQVTSQSSTATIYAKDIGYYLDGRLLSKDWPTATTGPATMMTDRIQAIITHELTTSYVAQGGTEASPETVVVYGWEQIDPPANVLPFLEVRSGTVLTRSNTAAFQMSVMEHLKDLARSGVDFSAIGRKFLVWDTEIALGRTRQVTENDFSGDPEVIQSGTDFAAIFHVVGSAEGDEAPPVGTAGRPDPYYGVWAKLHTSESEEGAETPTQWALNTQAQRQLRGRSPVPFELRMPGDAGFRLSHDLTINELLPGVEVPVLALLNLRKISQMQIIDKMKVVETSAGENISVTLVPSGPAQAV